MGLVFIFKFQSNVGKVIERIKNINKDGLHFSDQPPVTSELFNETKGKDKYPLEVATIPTLSNNENFIREYLVSQKLSEKDALNLLIQHMAELSFVIRCERIYVTNEMNPSTYNTAS